MMNSVEYSVEMTIVTRQPAEREGAVDHIP